jgi:hypothetical protein
MTTNLHKLSLPKSLISTNDNDTFSKDLLRQFDKKRSRLHFELGFASQVGLLFYYSGGRGITFCHDRGENPIKVI